MKKVWKTKDGKIISISEMSTEHLKNAIKMLRNKGCVTSFEFDESWAVACSFNTESMASYYAMQGVDDLKISKSLEYLEEELYKRESK